MTIINWPAGVRRLGGGWHLAVSSGTPGRGLAGHQQIINRENRFWQCDLALGVMGQAVAPVWQAFVDDMCGMANRIRMPVCNVFRPRIPGVDIYHYSDIATPAQILTGVEYSDMALFGDGAGFALPGVSDPVTMGTRPAGATILTVTGATATLLGPGAFFSVAGCLYRIAVNDAGTIRFNPPLRQAVPDGTEINVTNPWIICRFVSDDTGRLTLDRQHRGEPMRIGLVEAFDR